MQKPSAQTAKWIANHASRREHLRLFCCHRDLHSLDRSLSEVERRLGVLKTYLAKASSSNGLGRTAAFDRAQDEIDQAQRDRRIREMNDWHAEITAAALRKVPERLDTIGADTLRRAELRSLIRKSRLESSERRETRAVNRRGWTLLQ
jgi:hypothetical protein